MTSTDGHPEELYSKHTEKQENHENPGVARHFPVLLAGLLGVGEGAGTYTGSVGGSLIHLEAHFEILEFSNHFLLHFLKILFLISKLVFISFSVLATRTTCRVLDRA